MPLKKPLPPDQDNETFLVEARRKIHGAVMYTAAISLAMNLLMLALPLYSLQILDRVVSSRSFDTLIMLTVVAVVLLIGYGLLQGARSYLLIRVGNWLEANVGPKLLQMSVTGAAVNHPIGTSQNLRDLSTLKTVLSGGGVASLFDAPWSIIFLIIIFLIHPIICLITVIGGILLLIFAIANEALTNRKLKRGNQKQIQSYNEASAFIRYADAIEAMGMMENALRHWYKSSREALDWQGVAHDQSAAIQALSRSVRMLLQIGIMGTGGYLAINDAMSLGGMIACSILAGRALAPFEAMIGVWKQVVASRDAYRRLNHAISVAPERKQTMKLPEPAGNVVVDSLFFRPVGAEKPTLKAVSFEVQPGESIGIIGPSAAGKSTLGKLLVGVWKPTNGSVRLDGADVYTWNRADFGQYIGYLPQDPGLFPGTVAENIARLHKEANPDDITAAAEMAGVHEMILQLADSYDTPIDADTGATRLSPGQCQRIGLARALYGNPKMVLLDEPNSNLDGPGERMLLEAIRRIKERGITLFVIAHKPSILREVDKIMALKQGVIETFGPRDELMARYTRPIEAGGDAAAPLRATGPYTH